MTNPRGRLVLPVILTATFMASFDYMVVNVAAPSLHHDLNAGPAALELIVGGYGFTYACGLVTGGRLGDLLGHRRLFTAGMAAFALASLLCGLSRNPAELVGARLLQGLAASLMAPQVLALITAVLPASERPRALGWYGVTLGLGGIAGQVLGGVLIDADVLNLGWRAIFLVNVPIGAATVALARHVLPAAEPRRAPPAQASGREAKRVPPGGGERREGRFDPVGVVGLAGALALALAPLVLGREQGWPAWTWVSLAASVPVMLATLRWERRLGRAGGAPLLDLTLFRVRSFSIGLGVNIGFTLSFGSQMFVQTLLLQAGLGLSALRAGLVFVPGAVLSMAPSLLGRRLVARFGLRAVLAAGVATIGAGLLGLAVELETLGAHVTAAAMLPPMIVVGVGQGLALPTFVGVVLAGIEPARAGAASGVVTTGQQFGGAAGIAVVGAVFFSEIGAHAGRGDYARAAASGIWLDLAFVLGMAALTALLPRGAAPAAPKREEGPRKEGGMREGAARGDGACAGGVRQGGAGEGGARTGADVGEGGARAHGWGG